EDQIAEVYFVADHVLAARLENAALERDSVVRRLGVKPAQARVLLAHRLENLRGGIFRAVLGEDDLVVPLARVEAGDQLGGGRLHDRRLVVDGNDDAEPRHEEVAARSTDPPSYQASGRAAPARSSSVQVALSGQFSLPK